MSHSWFWLRQNGPERLGLTSPRLAEAKAATKGPFKIYIMVFQVVSTQVLLSGIHLHLFTG